jgi:hypothetical protein
MGAATVALAFVGAHDTFRSSTSPGGGDGYARGLTAAAGEGRVAPSGPDRGSRRRAASPPRGVTAGKEEGAPPEGDAP